MDNMYSMKDSCVALHEWYINLLEAGFSKKEALTIIIGVICGNGS